MARYISNTKTHQVPDISYKVNVYGRKDMKKTEIRERVLANKAKGLGLTMSISAGGMYRFKRENGMESVVYGLWAAREFIRGVEFILATDPTTYQMNGWIEPEKWKNE